MIDGVIDSIQSPQTTRQPIPDAILRAPVVLGYSGGNSWPTYGPYRAARPDLDRVHRVIPVTLSCVAFGHVYDIEPGGGQNKNIGVFMHNAIHVWKTPALFGKPWLYTFAANGTAMLAAARSFGYLQGRDFYYLAAHPGVAPDHICGDGRCRYPSADGCQHTFAGAIDVSRINDYMVSRVAPPPPPKHAKGKFAFNGVYDHDAKTVRVVGDDKHSNVTQWGEISERIDLGITLEVGGHNPKHGQWSGKVQGTEGP